MRFRRRRSTLSYEVPQSEALGEQMAEAMVYVATSGRRAAVSVWRRRCEASLRASRARRR